MREKRSLFRGGNQCCPDSGGVVPVRSVLAANVGRHCPESCRELGGSRDAAQVQVADVGGPTLIVKNGPAIPPDMGLRR